MEDIKLVIKYEAIVSLYVEAFFRKHHLFDELTGEYFEFDWVSDEVGGVLMVNDYFISFYDIKYDIDNEIDTHMYFDYYSQIESGGENIGYKTYIAKKTERKYF